MTVVAFIAAYLIMLGYFIRAVNQSPEGYENSTGFHYGKEPLNENCNNRNGGTQSR